MHERYGIELSAPGLLESRTARWLAVRVGGLLAVDSRLLRALAPERAPAGCPLLGERSTP